MFQAGYYMPAHHNLYSDENIKGVSKCHICPHISDGNASGSAQAPNTKSVAASEAPIILATEHADQPSLKPDLQVLVMWPLQLQRFPCFPTGPRTHVGSVTPSHQILYRHLTQRAVINKCNNDTSSTSYCTFGL